MELARSAEEAQSECLSNNSQFKAQTQWLTHLICYSFNHWNPFIHSFNHCVFDLASNTWQKIQDVAARGLDLSSVDWIVQYNPPVTAEEYVHRVGRTARVGKCGQAIIFLAPPETDFVHHLAKRGLR